ncbi:hypothetical protein Tco_0608425 [Tanacetum coccineum]
MVLEGGAWVFGCQVGDMMVQLGDEGDSSLQGGGEVLRCLILGLKGGDKDELWDEIEGNYGSNVMLKKLNMSSSGSFGLYATGPTLLRILNGPMYRGLLFESDDNFSSLQALSDLYYLFGGLHGFVSGP